MGLELERLLVRNASRPSLAYASLGEEALFYGSGGQVDAVYNISFDGSSRKLTI